MDLKSFVKKLMDLRAKDTEEQMARAVNTNAAEVLEEMQQLIFQLEATLALPDEDLPLLLAKFINRSEFLFYLMAQMACDTAMPLTDKQLVGFERIKDSVEVVDRKQELTEFPLDDRSVNKTGRLREGEMMWQDIEVDDEVFSFEISSGSPGLPMKLSDSFDIKEGEMKFRQQYCIDNNNRCWLDSMGTLVRDNYDDGVPKLLPVTWVQLVASVPTTAAKEQIRKIIHG